MTRKDYMEGRVTHEQFYSSVAKAAGVSLAGALLLPRVRAALAAGDQHLNTIPLKLWDAMAAHPTFRANAARALKEHGDFLSLAGGVCILKQAAREAAGVTP